MNRLLRIIGGVLLVVSLGFAAIISLEGLRWFTTGLSVVPGLELLFGEICHHEPSRTFHLYDQPMPVCARCTGLYGGAVVAAVFGIGVSLRRNSLRFWIGAWGVALLFGVGAAILEAAGGLQTSNETRFILGVLLPLFPIGVGVLGGRILLKAPSHPRQRRIESD